ncbi:hypothetical protein GG851_23665 [Bordetella petrii]|nr:hypothetical protein [Bordetella petrii]
MPVARVSVVAVVMLAAGLGVVFPSMALASDPEPQARSEPEPRPGTKTSRPGAEVRLQFNIPAQALDTALLRYQALTGQSVFYETRLASGKQSTAVKGRHSARQALRRMLAGTGLTAQIVNGRSVMLKPEVRLEPEASLVASAQAVRRYDGQTQLRLGRALCGLPGLLSGRHRVALRYWVDSAGRIEALKVRIAAAPELEQGVEAALMGRFVGAPPPGVARSAVVLIHAGAEQRELCAP